MHETGTDNLPHRFLNPLYGGISILVFAYVFIRSIALDITYDEAMTLIDFVPQSVYHILNFTPCDANNHILNTLAIKFLFTFLPATEFVCRLPNVLSFILFLYSGYRLCNGFLKVTTGVVAFLLLTLNPFCLDFFGLARGYGMALALQITSLYHLFCYLRDERTHSFVKAFVWAGLTVLASLSTLNYYIGLVGAFALYKIFFSRKAFWKSTLIVFSISVILTLIIWEPVRKLIEEHSLYYGGSTGFYEDTLLSLARYSMYSMTGSKVINNIALAFFLLLTIAFVLSLFGKNKRRTPQLVVAGILLISASSTIVQHHVLNNLYLVDRTALFFYPLLILVLCLSLEALPKKQPSDGVALLLITAFCFNFFSRANFYKTVTWYFDSHTTEILDAVKRENGKGTKGTIDYSWPFESGIHHYLKKKDYASVSIIKKGYVELDSTFDYYIYLGKTLDRIGYEPEKQVIVGYNRKDTVLSFPEEGVYLFRNKD